jgi:hypothetical protein
MSRLKLLINDACKNQHFLDLTEQHFLTLLVPQAFSPAGGCGAVLSP